MYILAISKISFDEVDNIKNKYSKNKEIKFPLTGNDLINIYSGVELGVKLQIARDVWINSDFNCSKSELIDFCKNNIIL